MPLLTSDSDGVLTLDLTPKSRGRYRLSHGDCYLICLLDLGVNILADLSPEIHLNGIVRAAYGFLSNVRVAFRYMDKEMFRNIYVTY
ncbi:hypothetical protein SK128_015055, partial [Halocaridina rubra]